MDDNKGLKQKGRDRIIPKFSEAGRIIVTGYDTGLPLDDVATALRNHFSRCGMITDVSIPLNFERKILQRRGYIYFVGEGAVDKALQLNGSDMGGRKVSVEAYPYQEDANDMVFVRVEGYDTSLSRTDLKSALSNHFSSYGKIKQFFTIESSARAMIYGKDVADKVTELNGSDMGGHKLAVLVTAKPRIPTVHGRQHRQRPPPTLPVSNSSSRDAAIPKSRSESSKTPDKFSKKKRKLSEEATMECKAISSSVEKQTPDLDGLIVEELCMGNPNGKKAEPGKMVTVHYTGKLLANGEIFESKFGDLRYKFRLGVGHVIKGLDVGVNGMRVDGKRKLTIPPAMGFGPDAWLVFDVELLNVK